MTKSAWAMKAMLGAVLTLALFAAPRPAAAAITLLWAPKTTASYHLARNDPPVNVKLFEWYCSDTDLWLEIRRMYYRVTVQYGLNDAKGIRIALNIRDVMKKMDWPGWPMTAPLMRAYPVEKGLDAPPGGRKVYRFKYCATRAEMLRIQKTVMLWLNAVWNPAVRGRKSRAAEKKMRGWARRRFSYSHTITITVYRARCDAAAEQRAKTLTEKLEKLREAFQLEEDRKKKDEIARRMRATVKALTAIAEKLKRDEENIKNDGAAKARCARQDQQALKALEDAIAKTTTKGQKTSKEARGRVAVARRAPRERAAGCHFSKPRIMGQGKPGFAGFPKDFPRPPGLETGWTLATAKGTLYVLGVSGGRLSTVRFVKKALPARGWRIIRTKTTRNPGAKTDSVHIFFSNTAYCGWVTIGTGAPMPTSMNVFLKKRRSQARGG